MPSPMSLLDPNSPQVRALMERNPNGVFAMLLKNAWAKTGGAPQTNLAAGSNNAGGIMNNPAAVPTSGMRASFGGVGATANTNMFANSGRRGEFPGGAPLGVGYTDNNSGSNFGNGAIASFAAGGMVTPQGGAVRPGAGMQPEPQLGAAPDAELTPQMIDQEATRFVQQHPEEAQKIQALIALATQTGDLTPQELNMAVQLAKTALANPSAYPQVRQFAIQNGLGTEQDIPQQMDKGMLYILIVAGKSAQAVGPQGNAMQGQGPSPTMEGGIMPSYAEDGGHTGDKTHIAKLHEHEYVIPKDALIYHGKKHFDKLVEQARTPPDAGGQK